MYLEITATEPSALMDAIRTQIEQMGKESLQVSIRKRDETLAAIIYSGVEPILEGAATAHLKAS